jgi:hypothetical protein
VVPHDDEAGEPGPEQLLLTLVEGGSDRGHPPILRVPPP